MLANSLPSRRKAIFAALAKALKMASILWCSIVPSALIFRLQRALSEKDLKEAKALLMDPEITVEAVARRLGVGPSTWYHSHAADVLHSLVMDAQATGYTFEDWCADFGYDSDSRKAYKVYEACLESGVKLRRIFTSTQIARLFEILQEY